VTAHQNQPKIRFTVEMGTARRPRLKIGGQGEEIPLELTANEAAELGRALLCASFAATVKQPPPAGTPLKGCEFPVRQWGVGLAETSGLPMLAVRIAGNADLVLIFHPKDAKTCGMSLAEEADRFLANRGRQ
jgi:hypothetical protein